MTEIDKTLDEALRAEEADLLRRIGEEPGYLNQAMSVFEGRMGWVSTVLMITQAVAFVAGAWAAWNFFQATDVLAALRWGLPSSVLLIMSVMIKMSMWPTIQTNRVLRELKRMELQASVGLRG